MCKYTLLKTFFYIQLRRDFVDPYVTASAPPMGTGVKKTDYIINVYILLLCSFFLLITRGVRKIRKQVHIE